MAHKIDELFNNPGVTVPAMTVDDALQYIMDVGMLVAGLPGSMAFARHQTLAGHLIYVDEERLGANGKRDAVILLKAITRVSKERAEQLGLAEAVARLNMATYIVQYASQHGDKSSD